MISLLLFACTSTELFTENERKIILRMLQEENPKAESSNQYTENSAVQNFGESLFFDTRLSREDSLSCASCHDPELGWADGKQFSEGRSTTPRHAPSLWGTASYRWYNWDGSCDSLWCQAAGPIEKPGEMGLTRVALVHVLHDNPDLKTTYEDIFGPLPAHTSWPVSGSPHAQSSAEEQESWETLSSTEQHAATQVLVNIAKSIAAFEHTIIPPQAPIDDFVRVFQEDEQLALDSMTAEQEYGLRLFIGEGQCHLCHSGSLFSDSQFHNVGLPVLDTTDPDDLGRYQGIETVVSHPFNQAGEWSDDPLGEEAEQLSRILVTSEDLGRYKTPSLRQVVHSAPYMHTGQFDSLFEVFSHYSNPSFEPVQGHTEDFLLPLDWGEEEINALIQFVQMASNEIE